MSDFACETRELSMRFGGVLAVNNVNFALRPKELRCLIGPNGAGKSTLFKSLSGQHRVRHGDGRIYILGEDVTGWRPHEIVRLGVGIKTQVPSVMNGLTVRENLLLAARRVLSGAEVEPAVDSALEELSLGAIARRLVGDLAHGQRQVVELGMVFVQGASLVLLDEPAAGITGAESERLVKIIHRINKTAAVAVVDHDMQFVRMLGGRVTVLHQGAVLTEGTADKVMSDPRVREVYIGTRAR